MPAGSPAPAPLTGFGAHKADWDAHHVAVPKLTNVYQHPFGRYVAMSFGDNDVAFSYEIDLTEGTSIESTRAMAMREFPDDTKVLWYQEYPLCALMEVESPRLAAALGDPKIGGETGRAMVVVYNNPGGKENPDGDWPLIRSRIDAIGIGLIDEPVPPPGDGNC